MLTPGACGGVHLALLQREKALETKNLGVVMTPGPKLIRNRMLVRVMVIRITLLILALLFPRLIILQLKAFKKMNKIFSKNKLFSFFSFILLGLPSFASAANYFRDVIDRLLDKIV